MNEPVDLPGQTPGLRSALLRHYDRTARDLPWRRDTDPYRIWVSEVMLQQTRVETVTGYYEAWLRRFPTVGALAAAEEGEVLKAWEGLGYYRRARNLHRGASVVRDAFAGRVPATYQELKGLPGVGDYTAGAIASIAFGEVVPAVDGNVRRVMARVFDVENPGPAWLRRTASSLVDPERPGDWNQALMDLGATVCTPTRPACGSCPLAPWCGALAAGTQESRPRTAKRRPVPVRIFATAVVIDGNGRRLVVRRPEGGLLAGLWSFPDAEAGEEDPCVHARAAALGLGVDLDPAHPPRQLADVKHRFTHLAATYRAVLLRGSGTDGEGRRWLDTAGLARIALPVAQQKIAAAAEVALSPE